MQRQLGATLWGIADQLRGAMNADDFRDYMLSFLFLRYLSDNYEAAVQKELARNYPKPAEGDRRTPLAIWYEKTKNILKRLKSKYAERFITLSSLNIFGAAYPSWQELRVRIS